MSACDFRYGVLWLCSVALSAALMPRHVSAQAVISEVMWMGTDLSSADEWMEIASVYSDTLDISGWTISYLKDGSEAGMIRFESGAVLGAGGIALISNYGKSQSRLDTDPLIADTSVAIPNSNLKLILRDSAGNLMDEVDDGSGAPFAGANPSGSSGKASMERVDLHKPGTDPNNWKSAVESEGFDDGVEIYGTPGYENSAAAAADDESGAIEAIEENVGTRCSVPECIVPMQDLSGAAGSGAMPIIPRVYISEILPNPLGTDDREWIEIVNDENFEVDLSGWAIKRSGDEYRILDYSISSGGIAVFNKSETWITFRNSGDTVIISSGSLAVDSISYPSAGEEISFGRRDGERDSFVSYCVPTKGERNRFKKLYPRIRVESGRTQAVGKTSVNFIAESDHGSLESAECFWDFDDGGTSDKCNPPSRAFSEPKVYAVGLSVETACGTFEEAVEYVEVIEEIEAIDAIEAIDETKDIEDGSDKSCVGARSCVPVQVASSGVPVRGASSKVSAGGAGVSVQKADEEEILCEPTISSGVTISEILPAPSFGEEWIRISNLTGSGFNLCGWFLDDARDGGSKPWTAPDGLVIAPNGFVTLGQSLTRLALNNAGDEAWLISPDGKIEIGAAYSRAKKDEILSGAKLENPADGGLVEPILELSYTGGYREENAKPDGLNGAAGVGNDRNRGEILSAVETDAHLRVRTAAPLEVRYMNVIDGESEEESVGMEILSGALMGLNVVEGELMGADDPVQGMGEPAAIAALILGAASSIGLFALKMMKGW